MSHPGPTDSSRSSSSAAGRTTPPRPLGAPYCNVCGYDLTGCVDSSKCPECGGALVHVLTRPEISFQGGRRYRSNARVMGLPAIDIAMGPSANEPQGKAHGFIAIGDSARGFIAIGGKARGVVAIGGFAMGGLTLGGTSVGVVSIGGMAFGGLAGGGMAIGGLANGGGAGGVVAQGGAAGGFIARGGGAFAKHYPTSTGDGIADKTFDALAWFFGGTNLSMGNFMMPFGFALVLAILIVGPALAKAFSATNKVPGAEVDSKGAAGATRD